MQKLPRKDLIHIPTRILRAPFPARSRLHKGQDGAGRRGESCPTSAGPAAPCSPLPGLCLPEQSRQRPHALQAGRGQRFSRRRHRPPRPGPSVPYARKWRRHRPAGRDGAAGKMAALVETRIRFSCLFPYQALAFPLFFPFPPLLFSVESSPRRRLPSRSCCCAPHTSPHVLLEILVSKQNKY